MTEEIAQFVCTECEQLFFKKTTTNKESFDCPFCGSRVNVLKDRGEEDARRN